MSKIDFERKQIQKELTVIGIISSRYPKVNGFVSLNDEKFCVHREVSLNICAAKQRKQFSEIRSCPATP